MFQQDVLAATSVPNKLLKDIHNEFLTSWSTAKLIESSWLSTQHTTTLPVIKHHSFAFCKTNTRLAASVLKLFIAWIKTVRTRVFFAQPQHEKCWLKNDFWKPKFETCRELVKLGSTVRLQHRFSSTSRSRTALKPCFLDFSPSN